MKILIFILFCFIAVLSRGQVDTCTQYDQDDSLTFANYKGTVTARVLIVQPYTPADKCKDSVGWVAMFGNQLRYWLPSGWVTLASSASSVTSVFGRTGDIIAQSADYAAYYKAIQDSSRYSPYSYGTQYGIDTTAFRALTGLNAANASINARVKYTDTSAMLSYYMHRSDSNSYYATPYRVDTGVKNTRTWTNLNFQPSLGFTPENVANKATGFGTLNNTLYPTTLGVSSYVNGLGFITLGSLSASSPMSYNNSTGAFTLGTVPISKGGTGQVTAQAALNALLPAQTNGFYLTTDGTNSYFTALTFVGGISCVDGSLNIAPTFGNVFASLNMANANTWQAAQTYSVPSVYSSLNANGGVIYNNGSGQMHQTAAGTAHQVLHAGASPSWGLVDLTADVTGLLPDANISSAATWNAKGSVSSITAGAGLNGGTITTTGTISMPVVIAAATYGSSTTTDVITVDAFGRLTGVTSPTVTPNWNWVTNTPTTVAGYGITDAYTKTASDARFYPLSGNPSNFLTSIGIVAGSGVTVTGSSPVYTVSATGTTYTAGNGLSLTAGSFLINYGYSGTWSVLETFSGGINTPTVTATGVVNIASPTSTVGVLNVNGSIYSIENSVTPTTFAGFTLADFECTAANYAAINVQNHSAASNASGDYTGTANNGTDLYHYFDIGINSSGWNGVTVPFNGYNQVYFYAVDDSMAIGTDSLQPLLFATNDLYRGMFDPNGNFILFGSLSEYSNGTSVPTTAWVNQTPYLTDTITTVAVLSTTVTPTVKIGSTKSDCLVFDTLETNNIYLQTPAGGPVLGQVFELDIYTSSAKNLTYNAIYLGTTNNTLPTVTTAGKTIVMVFTYQYNHNATTTSSKSMVLRSIDYY